MIEFFQAVGRIMLCSFGIIATGFLLTAGAMLAASVFSRTQPTKDPDHAPES